MNIGAILCAVSVRRRAGNLPGPAALVWLMLLRSLAIPSDRIIFWAGLGALSGGLVEFLLSLL